MRPAIFVSVSGSRRIAVAMSVKRGTSRLLVYCPPPPAGLDGVPEKKPMRYSPVVFQIGTFANPQPSLRWHVTPKIYLSALRD